MNRLYWLVARQFNLLLRNVSLSREMGVDIELALIYLQISRVIERVGDHVVKVAESIRSLMYTSLEKRMIDSSRSRAGSRWISLRAVWNRSLKRIS